MSSRPDTTQGPHHVISPGRNQPDPEPRLRQTSLYGPDLDLVVGVIGRADAMSELRVRKCTDPASARRHRTAGQPRLHEQSTATAATAGSCAERRCTERDSRLAVTYGLEQGASCSIDPSTHSRSNLAGDPPPKQHRTVEPGRVAAPYPAFGADERCRSCWWVARMVQALRAALRGWIWFLTGAQPGVAGERHRA